MLGVVVMLLARDGHSDRSVLNDWFRSRYGGSSCASRNAAAFSSFFARRRWRPPCRRSRPVTEFAKLLECPGDEGAAKEYSGSGALGFVGLELLLADDNGSAKPSWSFNLFFCRDKKWCLCFSSFLSGRESFRGGTSVDVDALAEEYKEALLLFVAESTKLVVDPAIIMRFSACEL